ncbi:carbohydrate esterase family 4 protein [Roridomyces roridus]|uniref:chitin deacetylase n=1 Tax=Roridomyces roridus TaxID=1738132 RepID=A0AAD7FEH5_9AGAR|nr:carbohydrate esterase family 4 protein [Roridomyces roridus]
MTVLSLLGLAAAVYAHPQATRTSEATEAAISSTSSASLLPLPAFQKLTRKCVHTDPSTECQPYTYPPVAQAMSSFPDIWEYAAKILPGDAAGHTKYASFNASIPKIAPKGTLTDSTKGTTYSDSDPDCWWTYSNCVKPKLSGLVPDVSDVPEPRTLGYGFDDGPYCGHNVWYDYLSSQNQKATMFYIGSNVMSYPLEAQRAITDGHEICVHTWSHNYMTATSNEGAFAELWYSLKAIKLVTGVTATCWRPPYGDVDDRIRYIAAQLGLETILWKYDTDDGSEGSDGVTPAVVQKNYDDFITKASQGAFNTVGAILLTHELTNFTMQTSMDYHPKLLQVFDHIVPISVAQNKTTPYLETNYTMPTFAEYIAGTTQTNGSTPASGSSSASASASGSLPAQVNPGSPTANGAAQPSDSSPSPSSSSGERTGKNNGVVGRLQVGSATPLSVFGAAVLAFCWL